MPGEGESTVARHSDEGECCPARAPASRYRHGPRRVGRPGPRLPALSPKRSIPAARSSAGAGTPVRASRSVLSGPGAAPSSMLPARYFVSAWASSSSSVQRLLLIRPPAAMKRTLPPRRPRTAMRGSPLAQLGARRNPTIPQSASRRGSPSPSGIPMMSSGRSDTASTHSESCRRAWRPGGPQRHQAVGAEGQCLWRHRRRCGSRKRGWDTCDDESPTLLRQPVLPVRPIDPARFRECLRLGLSVCGVLRMSHPCWRGGSHQLLLHRNPPPRYAARGLRRRWTDHRESGDWTSPPPGSWPGRSVSTRRGSHARNHCSYVDAPRWASKDSEPSWWQSGQVQSYVRHRPASAFDFVGIRRRQPYPAGGPSRAPAATPIRRCPGHRSPRGSGGDPANWRRDQACDCAGSASANAGVVRPRCPDTASPARVRAAQRKKSRRKRTRSVSSR